MPKTKTTQKPREVSQQSRPAPRPRAPRSGKNGGEQRGQDRSAFSVSGLHDVVKNLRPYPFFEAEYRAEDIEANRGLNSLINTEERQLQAIEDLYRIVKAQPRYKKLKEPNWKVETSPFAILNWLLRKLGPLAAGNAWTVDTWKEGKRNRYQFVAFKHFNGNNFKHRAEWMPLDFLPILRRKDKALHDMVVDTVALVSKCNKMPLWDEDGDFSTAIQKFCDAQPFLNSMQEEQRTCYQTGEAADYLRLIKRRRRVITPADIYSQLAKYFPKSVRKRNFVNWIRAGIDLADSKGKITDYSFIPGYESFGAIGCHRLYKFVWSINEKDHVANVVYKSINGKDWQYPLMFTIARPGQKLQPIKPATYPVKLYDFLSEGVKHVLWRWTDYYYPIKKKKGTMPCEILLNKIEESELRVRV